MSRIVMAAAAGALSAAAVLLASLSARAETIRVEVQKLAFSPAQISAHVGDTIEWDNPDFLTHSATARDHQWDVTLPPHKTGRTVLKTAGKIEYFCRFHPNMTGEITVEAK